VSCTATCHRPSQSQAHCGAAGCHRTFRNVDHFDRHRRDGTCVDPATLGMVEVDRIWASPEAHRAAAQARGVLETSRSRRASRRQSPEPPAPLVRDTATAAAPGSAR
jgi:hypothetical protein